MNNTDKKSYAAPKLVTHGNVEDLTGQSTKAKKLVHLGGNGGSGEERPFGS